MRVKAKFVEVAKVFIDIMDDDELSNKLLSLPSIDKVYDFFKAVQPHGYTEQEFYEFFNALLTIYEKEIVGRKNDDILKEVGLIPNNKKIDNNNLNVAGGGKFFEGIRSKIVAGTLAAVTAATPFIPSANASVYRGGKSGSSIVNVDRKPSFFQRHKDLFKKIAIGAAIVGIVAAAAVGLYVLSKKVNKKSDEEKEQAEQAIKQAKEEEAQLVSENVLEQRNFKEKKNELETELKGKTKEEEKKIINEQIQKAEENHLNAQKNFNDKRSQVTTTINNNQAKLDKPSKSTSDIWVDKVTTPISRVLGPGIAVCTLASMAVDKASSFSKQVQNISNLDYSMQTLSRAAERWSSKVVSTEKAMPPTNEAIKELETIFDSVVGQEGAKAQLRNIGADIIIKKDMERKTGIQSEMAELVFLVGSSGTGKTYTMQKLAPSISSSTLDTFVFSSGNINKESGRSVVEQMFGSVKRRWGGEVQDAANFIEEIKKDKNRVFIIDEYDKYSTPATDELFRTAHDSGYIMTPDGETVDCTGAVFAFTSNELGPEELKDVSKNLTPSRTIKHRDVSFCNRIHWVYFKPHIESTFERMLVEHFSEITAKYWELPEVAGFNLGLDSDAAKIVCKWLVERDQGARPIDNDILTTMNGDVVNYMKQVGLENMKGKYMKIILDPDYVFKGPDGEISFGERILDKDDNPTDKVDLYGLHIEGAKIKFKVVEDTVPQEVTIVSESENEHTVTGKEIIVFKPNIELEGQNGSQEPQEPIDLGDQIDIIINNQDLDNVISPNQDPTNPTEEEEEPIIIPATDDNEVIPNPQIVNSETAPNQETLNPDEEEEPIIIPATDDNEISPNQDPANPTEEEEEPIIIPATDDNEAIPNPQIVNSETTPNQETLNPDEEEEEPIIIPATDDNTNDTPNNNPDDKEKLKLIPWENETTSEITDKIHAEQEDSNPNTEEHER